MHQSEIVELICSSTIEVFATMLGLEVQPGEPRVEQAAPGPTDGVVSLIGMAGTWAGTGSISCCASAACGLSSRFLMAEYPSVNEEVLDAIAELTNMIIGSFKSAIEEKLGPMGLSIPTVIFGRNFTTRTTATNDWILVPFTADTIEFDIHVCLAPSQKVQHRPFRPDHAGAEVSNR
jgi:chemotaxis protein CheX